MAVAAAQQAQRGRPPGPASLVAERVRALLDDSSTVRRDRAVASIRRASPAVRQAAVAQFAAALSGPRREHRLRALMALGQMVVATQGQVGAFDGGADVVPVAGAVARVAGDSADELCAAALMLLAEAGRSVAAQSLPVGRRMIATADPAIREGAVAVLAAVGDSTDAPRVAALLTDRSPEVRTRAAAALAQLGRPGAAVSIASLLTDPEPRVRAAALHALARLGPAARAVLPRVAAMIGDTTDWRGGASYHESLGAEAAWTASRIAPRRGVAMIPARLEVDDRGTSLRSDGLGAYVTSADSVKVFLSAALNVDLAGPRGDGRSARAISERTLRRSLAFNLSRPAPGGGARAIGIIRDDEAIVHVFWRHEPARRMVSVVELDASDHGNESERTEFEFRVGGVPHLLQMGDWVASDLDPRAPNTNGKGTMRPHIWHPTPDEWTVVAPPGSLARLWSLADPAKPVDLGLYQFSFALTWQAILPR